MARKVLPVRNSGEVNTASISGLRVSAVFIDMYASDPLDAYRADKAR